MNLFPPHILFHSTVSPTPLFYPLSLHFFPTVPLLSKDECPIVDCTNPPFCWAAYPIIQFLWLWIFSRWAVLLAGKSVLLYSSLYNIVALNHSPYWKVPLAIPLRPCSSTSSGKFNSHCSHSPQASAPLLSSWVAYSSQPSPFDTVSPNGHITFSVFP